MAETPISSSDLHPTYVAQPDMRFASGFLSHEYRDYAVKGESMVDKSSGELFIKRPTDGRVVSFFQNKKYLDEFTRLVCDGFKSDKVHKQVKELLECVNLYMEGNND